MLTVCVPGITTVFTAVRRAVVVLVVVDVVVISPSPQPSTAALVSMHCTE